MLENLLETCGFNSTEQKVLLHLIGHGESIASVIAKQIGIKRTTVYATLDELARLGVVGKNRRDKVSYFSVASSTIFTKVLEEQARQKFEETKTATKLLERELKTRKPELALGVFQIRSFESLEAVYVQLEDALLGGDFCAIFNPQVAFKGPFKDLVTSFLWETAKTKPTIREIAVAGSEAKWYLKQIKNPNHHVRLLPDNSRIFSDMIFVRGSLIFNHYDSKQETSIKITEKNLYHSMMTIFERLWESAEQT